MRYTLASYERLALGYLAVLRKDDGALIGRCGLMDMVVESVEPEQGMRRGWFGREEAPDDVELTFECGLGYTFDSAVWGRGYATEAACCVRDYARDVLGLSYVVSAILPQNARSRRVAARSGARAEGQMNVVASRGIAGCGISRPVARPGFSRHRRSRSKQEIALKSVRERAQRTD